MGEAALVISRRQLLLGAAGAGVVAVAAGCDTRPSGVPDVAPAAKISGSFVSAKRGGVRTGWTIAYPSDHSPGSALPVLVFLHGRGSDHNGPFGGSLHLDYFLSDAVRHGAPPFAIASVDGGDHSYWHPRRSGDTAGMVIDEFVPLLARHGLHTGRIGLMGNSMGGYGALYLATVLTERRCAVAVAESPAIWHHPWQSVAGAFDDAADFDAHAIFPRIARLRGIPLRIDCGDRDGFAPVTRDLRAAIDPTPAGGIEPGAHDSTYWKSQAPAQLRFVAAHLAAANVA